MSDQDKCIKTLKNTCFSWIPAIVASAAFICSLYFGFGCESIQFQPTSNNYNQGSLKFGPWNEMQVTYQTNNVGQYTQVTTTKTCVAWQWGSNGNSMVDSKWKTVRAFTVIVAVIGGLLMLALWFVPCRAGRISKSTWSLVAAINSILLTLFQGLTFLFFQSNACINNTMANTLGLYNGKCAWDAGSTANVVSVVLWFLTGVIMLLQGPPECPTFEPPETQSVTYQQETLKDGTTVVVEAKVVKGVAVQPEQGHDVEA